MTPAAQQFPYLSRDPSLAIASQTPMLPLMPIGRASIAASGLIDSGAANNVLPYSVGLQLGFDWETQTKSVDLSGNLSNIEARVIVISAIVGKFDPVRQAFAWARTDTIPVILGQVNFFLEFDVCFFRSRSVFEVRPRV